MASLHTGTPPHEGAARVRRDICGGACAARLAKDMGEAWQHPGQHRFVSLQVPQRYRRPCCHRSGKATVWSRPRTAPRPAAASTNRTSTMTTPTATPSTRRAHCPAHSHEPHGRPTRPQRRRSGHNPRLMRCPDVMPRCNSATTPHRHLRGGVVPAPPRTAPHPAAARTTRTRPWPTRPQRRRMPGHDALEQQRRPHKLPPSTWGRRHYAATHRSSPSSGQDHPYQAVAHSPATTSTPHQHLQFPCACGGGGTIADHPACRRRPSLYAMRQPPP